MNNKYYTQQYIDNDLLYLKCYIIKGGSYRFCWHNSMEIMLVLQGSADVFVEGEMHSLMTDDIIIINANCGHEAFCKNKDSIILVIEVFPDYFKRSQLGMDLLRIGCISTKSTRESPIFKQIRFYISQIVSYCMRDEERGSVNIKAFVDVLLSELMQNFTVYRALEDRNLNSKDGKILNKAVDYIEKNYQEKISLDDVAKHVGYNRTYFSTLFKKNTEISFNEYIMRLRLKKSIESIEDENLSIMDIALKNGFSSVAMFDKYMKIYCGVTPIEYRTKLKENPDMKRNDENNRYYDYPNSSIEKILNNYILGLNGQENDSKSESSNKKTKQLLEYCEKIAEVMNNEF